ncbi:MAG: hypothetical protein QOF49_370 [Chloroflexota bacterium]|jgi:hypothetical protein|nr:hypothetical protein [Chloroflexota bacterium]
MTTLPRATRILLAIALGGLAVGGCSAAAAPPAPSASPQPSPAATSPAPTEPPATHPAGGGTADDPGTGIGVDLPTGVAPVDPGAGQAALVIPRPGQKNPHPVAPTILQASVNGRHALVKVTWYGGVEPCSILDSVRVARTGTDIAISLFEGSGDENAMCIEIAVLKATIVDLGDLEPGTYQIASPGSDARPIAITID